MADQELEHVESDLIFISPWDMLGQPHIYLKHELCRQSTREMTFLCAYQPAMERANSPICDGSLTRPCWWKQGCSGIVSHLVALMIDQVQHLRSQRVNCSMSPLQVLYLESILPPTRAYSLLFCAPDMPKWRDALDSNEVYGRIVLLMKLIVSHRSKDFRQDYGRLAELRSLVRPGTPFMACTAIASGPFRTGTLSCSVR